MGSGFERVRSFAHGNLLHSQRLSRFFAAAAFLVRRQPDRRLTLGRETKGPRRNLRPGNKTVSHEILYRVSFGAMPGVKVQGERDSATCWGSLWAAR
jgi:hypothetical protein